MKSIYYIFAVSITLLVVSSCTDTIEKPAYELNAETLFGKALVNTGVVGSLHTDSAFTVANGVTESNINYLSYEGYVTKAYAFEVDISIADIDIAVCTANDYNTRSYSKQELSSQVSLVNGVVGKILGAINGDYYVASGRPNGILIKNGNAIKTPASKPSASYFAITKDKQAVIGDEADLKSLGVEHLRDAVGGKDWLVKNGEIMPQVVPTKEAKTAIGITSEGKVVMFIVDGGLYYYSNGMVLADVAKVMKNLGCVNAISLSSGRSSTLISCRSGIPVVRNIPSNNMIEEPISNGIVIIKK